MECTKEIHKPDCVLHGWELSCLVCVGTVDWRGFGVHGGPFWDVSEEDEKYPHMSTNEVWQALSQLGNNNLSSWETQRDSRRQLEREKLKMSGIFKN